MYQDLSDWVTDPDTYNVSITKPATSQAITLEVSGTNNTRISSDQIGTIIDGIYTFETTSCGVRYKRYKGLFFNLECCIKEAYLDVYSDYYPLIRDVQDHLKMTQAAIELNKLSLAEDLYDITRQKFNRVQCDCGC